MCADLCADDAHGPDLLHHGGLRAALLSDEVVDASIAKIKSPCGLDILPFVPAICATGFAGSKIDDRSSFFRMFSLVLSVRLC